MTHETPCTRSDLSARCLQPAFASFLPSLPPLFRIASWSTPHGRCRHLRRWWRPHPACQRWGVRAGELRRFPTRKAGPQQGGACGPAAGALVAARFSRIWWKIALLCRLLPRLA
jgi:hypothetical protein